MNKILRAVVMIAVVIHLLLNTVYGAENTVIFTDTYAENITEFLPAREVETNSYYPAWEFYSPGLNLNPAQQCAVSVSGGYLTFKKTTNKPSPENYGESTVAKRSLLQNSTVPANFKGKYIIEFTIKSQGGSTDGLGFQILSNQGTMLIDGFANNSKKVVEITKGNGESGRQKEDSTPYAMPGMGKLFNDIDVTLKFEIDTRTKTFRYYQSNINNYEAVPGIDGNIDRKLASQDSSKMSLGSIKFCPRNNVPINTIWKLKNLKLTELEWGDSLQINSAGFYKDMVDDEHKIIEISPDGERFSKLYSVMNIKNLTGSERSIAAIMAHYDSENRLSRLSDINHLTLSPLGTADVQLSVDDVFFQDRQSKTKVFLLEGIDTIKPAGMVKQLTITDLAEVRRRLQSGIYSSSINPSTVVSELGPDYNFTTVNYTLDSSTAGFGAEGALDKIKTMVCAYYSPGNAYYANAALKEKIDLALIIRARLTGGIMRSAFREK